MKNREIVEKFSATTHIFRIITAAIAGKPETRRQNAPAL